MTEKERLERLEAGQRRLEETLQSIEARLPPLPAAPAPPKPIPGMAPQGDYGVLYCGEPSAPGGVGPS
jgi:hypothetical protein